MRSAVIVAALSGAAFASYAAPPAPEYNAPAPAYVAPSVAPEYPTKTPEAPKYHTTTLPATVIPCPEPTIVTYGPSTVTVTKATTLTFTECPVTVPVYTPAPSVAPVQPAPAAPATNGTKPAPPAPYVPNAPATNAGAQLSAGIAGILAVVGLAAAL